MFMEAQYGSLIIILTLNDFIFYDVKISKQYGKDNNSVYNLFIILQIWWNDNMFCTKYGIMYMIRNIVIIFQI